MPILLLSKGADINAWRGAEEFAADFHKALAARARQLNPDQTLALYENVSQGLDDLAEYFEQQYGRLGQLVDQISDCQKPDHLASLVKDFFSLAYELFGRNSSAPAFFQMSQACLQALAGSLVAYARQKLGTVAEGLPPVAVIAVGPGGRLEFSPFCRLHLILVHGEAQPELSEPLHLLGRLLHEGFEAVGLLVDDVISPRNPEWSGSLDIWKDRLNQRLERGEEADLVDVLRLVDQSVLFADPGIEQQFDSMTQPYLRKNRRLLRFMIDRLHRLSNGLGLMGGLRLEKTGPNRGLFALLDNALLPLTASVTALHLLVGGSSVSTSARIQQLVSQQGLDVKTGEAVLQSWYTLEELRLLRELSLYPEIKGGASLYIDPERLSDADYEQLHGALEIIAILQRHVFITFNSWEDQ